MTFAMVQHHKWSLTEVENMLPWERDIYVDKVITFVKEENEKIKEQQKAGKNFPLGQTFTAAMGRISNCWRHKEKI